MGTGLRRCFALIGGISLTGCGSSGTISPPVASPTPLVSPTPSATPTSRPSPSPPALPSPDPTPTGSLSLSLGQGIPELPKLTQITSARDGSRRLFAVLQTGQIQILKDGVVQPTPFLDIADRVSCCGEQGLLGLAFPPGSKGHFYVNYTNQSGDTVIARYRVTSDPDQADPFSEEVILPIDQPYPNHNGGQLAFGPQDGFLYIGMGDGGSGGDPQNLAQNPAQLLGKLLRIDVESGVIPYAIPDSNPFRQVSGSRPEIWALGLRNPWRFSFDRLNGDLFLADVGQAQYEEVNVQPGHSGGGQNYGWNILEGTQCFKASSCRKAGLTMPVYEYSHGSGGCSITGGYVYRGIRFPALIGVYVYGDFCTGSIWGLQQHSGTWRNTLLLASNLAISTFGEDEAGELYVGDYGTGTLFPLQVP